MTDTTISHLDALEAESIHIMREVAAEFERPVLLFSGGKDSALMLKLAEKAFWPARIPFPLMHVDTGHNFDEVLDYRDRRAAELGVPLVVASVQESIDAGRVHEETGPKATRNRLQSVTLLDAIERARLRRRLRRRSPRRGQGPRQGARLLLPRRLRPVGPEEPAPRALEPLQRPASARASTSASSRSRTGPRWTSGSTSHARRSSCRRSTSRTSARSSAATACCSRSPPHVTLLAGEELEEIMVRFRTVGDATCTGAVESPAATAEEIIVEVAASRITERGATRADDKFTEAAMEDRKKEGYF